MRALAVAVAALAVVVVAAAMEEAVAVMVVRCCNVRHLSQLSCCNSLAGSCKLGESCWVQHICTQP